eukprot:scaffold292719_cov22-Tisochrysis_lutea.AAC.1
MHSYRRNFVTMHLIETLRPTAQHAMKETSPPHTPPLISPPWRQLSQNENPKCRREDSGGVSDAALLQWADTLGKG